MAKAPQTPDLRNQLSDQLGMDLVVSRPEALQTWLVSEIARWGKVVRESAIEVE